MNNRHSAFHKAFFVSFLFTLGALSPSVQASNGNIIQRSWRTFNDMPTWGKLVGGTVVIGTIIAGVMWLRKNSNTVNKLINPPLIPPRPPRVGRADIGLPSFGLKISDNSPGSGEGASSVNVDSSFLQANDDNDFVERVLPNLVLPIYWKCEANDQSVDPSQRLMLTKDASEDIRQNNLTLDKWETQECMPPRHRLVFSTANKGTFDESVKIVKAMCSPNE